MYRSNPVWPEFLELVTPVPVREASRETGPLTIELERLVRVPALLFRLFLEADVLRKKEAVIWSENQKVRWRCPCSNLKEKKNLIDGSSTLSVPFSNQMFVFSWTRVPSQANEYRSFLQSFYIILEVPVERFRRLLLSMCMLNDFEAALKSGSDGYWGFRSKGKENAMLWLIRTFFGSRALSSLFACSKSHLELSLKPFLPASPRYLYPH